MLIRQFNLERDYEAVIALWQASGPGVHLGASDTRPEIERKIQRDPDLFLVLEVDGLIAGAVLGGFDGRRGLVYHLAVAPGQRGRGWGTALLDELVVRLRARGCRKVYLLVTPDNEPVIAFYRQRGWDEMPVHILGKTLT